MAALRKVADATGAITMDLRSHFCWGGLCRTNDGHRWLFQDGIHIAVAESQSLAPEFTQVLKKIFPKKDWWVPPVDLTLEEAEVWLTAD